MFEKLPKILSAVGLFCLVLVIVLVYNWYQDHQAEQIELNNTEYTVAQESVVQRDEAAEAVVEMKAETLIDYRAVAKDRVEEIATLQTSYLDYWRKTKMTIDEAVNGMLEMNKVLNAYFPGQNMDTCWCDVGIEHGNSLWTGYVLAGGQDKIPCLWLGYLPSKARLLGYVYSEYDGKTNTFSNTVRGETVFGNSLSAYTNDTAMLKRLDPDVSTNVYPEYDMSDYQMVKSVANILKFVEALPADYEYKVGDDMSQFLQISGDGTDTEGAANE